MSSSRLSNWFEHMKRILSEIRSAALVTIVLSVVCCGVYPLVVYGIGQMLFPHQANGSLILDGHGNVQGSRLIGQPFAADRYFHSRPSAAGNGYDSTSSSGSNLGPTSQKLRDSVAQNVADYRAQNGLATNAPVPADAVSASGSGLDPHISKQNAELQIARVAKARNYSIDKIRALVQQNTDDPDFGVLGDAGVNVLKLNMALDGIN
jgi:potassium-transporting ATPase KdpC subunit